MGKLIVSDMKQPFTVFYNKAIRNYFVKLTEKDRCWSIFLTCNFIKGDFGTDTFLWNLRNLRGAASLRFICRMQLTFFRAIYFSAGKSMFKGNNKNTRTRCETCSKLTIRLFDVWVSTSVFRNLPEFYDRTFLRKWATS